MRYEMKTNIFCAIVLECTKVGSNGKQAYKTMKRTMKQIKIMNQNEEKNVHVQNVLEK